MYRELHLYYVNQPTFKSAHQNLVAESYFHLEAQILAVHIILHRVCGNLHLQADLTAQSFYRQYKDQLLGQHINETR